MLSTVFAILIVLLVLLFLYNSICIVSQQKNYIIERFGRYHRTLEPGLNFIIPIVDIVRQRVDLRETPLDVNEQICITKDNTQIKVDGILYIQVTDSKLAVYGTSNVVDAIVKLAQTSLRSTIGKMTLDETFSNRELMNKGVLEALEQAAGSWGCRLLRYEIRDLTPPEAILRAMQDQITAEREKRAKVIRSEAQKIEQINIAEGERQSAIFRSEGDKQAKINASEAERQARINQAEGEAESIRLLSLAQQESIQNVAKAIMVDGGKDAINLNVANEYIQAFAKLAKTNNTLVIPQNVSDIGGAVATALTAMKTINK